MRRPLGRLLMAVAGVFSFACYAGVAYLAYRLLRFAVVDRPSTLALVPVLMAGALFIAYLNYRYGARRLLRRVPTVNAPTDRAAAFADRVDRTCARMDVGDPSVLFADLEVPNGFALNGPRGGVVVVDVSLFEFLNDDQLEAMLAHELAHLENGDGLSRMLAFTGLQTAAGVVTLVLSPAIILLTGLAKASGWFRGAPSAWPRSLAWRVRKAVLAVVMVVPAVCAFLLLERSRRREFAADRRAADVTGKPMALADALRTVDDSVPEELRLEGALPFDDEYAPDVLYRLVSTHPAVEKRVSRLQRLETS